MKNTYEQNVRAMIRRRGKEEKYKAPGVYCIKLDERIVYIGKGKRMIDRVVAHFVGIQCHTERKYRIISEAAQALECPIVFDVLYYAKETDDQAILEEIGQKEGELIRHYRPLLNTQIPKEENWRTWDLDKRSTEEIMRLILEEKD